MKTITCDRCGGEGGTERDRIVDVKFRMIWYNDWEGRENDFQPIIDFDLCGECRQQLKINFNTIINILVKNVDEVLALQNSSPSAIEIK